MNMVSSIGRSTQGYGYQVNHHVKKGMIMSFSIDVSVTIDDYHHLRGGGGGAFIKELYDSHVGRACNNCNGCMIC